MKVSSLKYIDLGRDDNNFLTTYLTDIGIKKQTNQDALCIKTANTSFGRVAFCLVCDGMGGLSKGEVASAMVTTAFSDWFDYQLPFLMKNNEISFTNLQQQWNDIIFQQNNRLREYGSENGVQLGTTLTALLLVNEDYYIVNVGDSRAYEITEAITPLTKDQTVVAREIERGNLTEEQAELDPRRNVLLQCIGASSVVVPEFYFGEVKTNAVYMLCSDGFRHEISLAEIFQKFNPDSLTDEKLMEENAISLVNLCKARKEIDNISVIVIKTV